MLDHTLDIPAFLDLRNPDVRAHYERQRNAQLAPVKISHSSALAAADQSALHRNLPKTMTPEAWELLEEIENPKAIKKNNSLETCKDKKTTERKIAQGGRWDSRKNRWLTPEEDFAEMAERARDWDGNPMTIQELHTAFIAVSKLPDLPVTVKHYGDGRTQTLDPNPESCRAFARHILAALDQSKLAVEAERLARNARERMKRKNRGR